MYYTYYIILNINTYYVLSIPDRDLFCGVNTSQPNGSDHTDEPAGAEEPAGDLPNEARV